MNFRWTLLLGLSFCGLTVAASDRGTRVEELLIWKLSDELKLEIEQEKKFTQSVRYFNEERRKANEEIDSILAKLSKSDGAQNRENLLSEYQKKLVSFGRLTEKEFLDLKNILGSEKMAHYLVLKKDLSEKIKTLLSSPEKLQKVVPATKPRIIEGK